LRILGVGPDAISQTQKNQLDRDGLFILEDVLTRSEVESMCAAFESLYAAERSKAGHDVQVESGARRLSKLSNKTDAFDTRLWIPEILAVTHDPLSEIRVRGAICRSICCTSMI
jgi:hypothetical protein